ncbi:MAG: alpha/beta family hydrolase [Candidatus Dojkabacteria bacterium]
MPEYLHYSNEDNKELNIIIPGSSVGFEKGFIKKIFDKFIEDKKSAITFNHPFFTRGDESWSGEELLEEQNALEEVMQEVDLENFSKINFIGKSLGAIVLSMFLRKNPQLFNKSTFTVLGFVKGSLDLKKINVKTLIVQGENDKFGKLEEIKKDLNKLSKYIEFVEIKGADHSYRDESKQPIYEEEAIKLLFNFLNQSNP